MDEQIKTLERENFELHDRETDARQKYESIQKKFNDLNETHKLALKNLDSVNQRLVEAEHSNQRKISIQKLDTRNSHVNENQDRDLFEMRNIIEKEKEEKELLARKLQQLTKKHNSFEQSQILLVSQLDQARKEETQKEINIMRIKETAERLLSENKELRNLNNTLKREIESLEDQHRDLIEELNNRIASLSVNAKPVDVLQRRKETNNLKALDVAELDFEYDAGNDTTLVDEYISIRKKVSNVPKPNMRMSRVNFDNELSLLRLENKNLRETLENEKKLFDKERENMEKLV